MRKASVYLRAGLLAFAVLLIGSVFVAPPASAQQGNLDVIATCQPDGTYKLTYTFPWSDAPKSVLGASLLSRTDTNASFDAGWTSDPASYDWIDRGKVGASDGAISWSMSIPGTTEGAGRWEYAWLDLGNELLAIQFHSTRVTGLDGTCADTTAPEQVTVRASFSDSGCVDGRYSDPVLAAPEFAGTTRDVTGSAQPGGTVTVAYTALEGFWIVGQSVFMHTYPAEPSSQADCEDTTAAGAGSGGRDDEASGDSAGKAARPHQGGAVVPGSIDAGLPGDRVIAPVGPRWLAPLLGGVIILGLAAFSRLKQLGDQQT